MSPGKSFVLVSVLVSVLVDSSLVLNTFLTFLLITFRHFIFNGFSRIFWASLVYESEKFELLVNFHNGRKGMDDACDVESHENGHIDGSFVRNSIQALVKSYVRIGYMYVCFGVAINGIWIVILAKSRTNLTYTYE